jgi:hypothetical protein
MWYNIQRHGAYWKKDGWRWVLDGIVRQTQIVAINITAL